jgi:hypothetical protein
LPSDRQDVQVLQAAAGKPVEACVLGPRFSELLADPDVVVLVADSGRRVVGAVTARAGEVEELLVDPEWPDVADALRRELTRLG